MWAAQTPQVFRAAALRDVYARGLDRTPPTTPRCWRRAATRCACVPSTPANVKITTPADLPLAGALLSWEVEADV